MAIVLPPQRREHWVSKFDKKLSLIPLIGTATNLIKLFAKLFFKALESLLPPIYKPLKSLRVVRAITHKTVGTYIFQAIPFWFVLKAMAKIGDEQLRQDEQRRQEIAERAQKAVDDRIGPSLRLGEAAQQNFTMFRECSEEYTSFTSEFNTKTEELHQLKYSDSEKFESERLTNQQLIEISLQKAKTLADNLTTVYSFSNQQALCVPLKERLSKLIGERVALYYPDSSLPPPYLDPNDSFQQIAVESWKQSIPRMNKMPAKMFLESVARNP